MEEFKSSFDMNYGESGQGFGGQSPGPPMRYPSNHKKLNKKGCGCLLMVISLLGVIITPVLYALFSNLFFNVTNFGPEISSSNTGFVPVPSEKIIATSLINIFFGSILFASFAGFFVGIILIIIGLIKNK